MFGQLFKENHRGVAGREAEAGQRCAGVRQRATGLAGAIRGWIGVKKSGEEEVAGRVKTPPKCLAGAWNGASQGGSAGRRGKAGGAVLDSFWGGQSASNPSIY